MSKECRALLNPPPPQPYPGGHNRELKWPFTTHTYATPSHYFRKLQVWSSGLNSHINQYTKVKVAHTVLQCKLVMADGSPSSGNFFSWPEMFDSVGPKCSIHLARNVKFAKQGSVQDLYFWNIGLEETVTKCSVKTDATSTNLLNMSVNWKLK